jgi:hypothetical protein
MISVISLLLCHPILLKNKKRILDYEKIEQIFPKNT